VVLRVLFHPKQLMLVSAGEDAEVRVWDLVDKSCVAMLKARPARVGGRCRRVGAGLGRAWVDARAQRHNPVHGLPGDAGGNGLRLCHAELRRRWRPSMCSCCSRCIAGLRVAVRSRWHRARPGADAGGARAGALQRGHRAESEPRRLDAAERRARQGGRALGPAEVCAARDRAHT